jgi:hypothetical protein
VLRREWVCGSLGGHTERCSREPWPESVRIERADAGAVAIRVAGEGVVPLRLPPRHSARCARLPPRSALLVRSSERRGRLQPDPPRRLRACSAAICRCQRRPMISTRAICRRSIASARALSSA